MRGVRDAISEVLDRTTLADLMDSTPKNENRPVQVQPLNPAIFDNSEEELEWQQSQQYI